MNKKRLSVVMAGAMLASSVAPVLAAEEVSVTEVQKGNLIAELTDKLWDAPKFSNDYRVNQDRRNKSVYTIKINGTENKDIYDLTVSGDKAVLKSTLQKKIQTEINKLPVGAKVELVDLGSREVTENGKKLILSTNETTKYTAAELENTGDFKDNGSVKDEIELSNAGSQANAATVKIIAKHGYVTGTGYVIELTKEAAKTAGLEKIVLTTESERLDFKNYIKTDGGKANVPTTEVKDFLKFDLAAPKHVDIADVVETTYKIATDGTTLALSDIYDAPFLTEKGYELLSQAKAVKYVLATKEVSKDHDAEIVRNSANVKWLGTAINKLEADKDGVYTLKVEIANPDRVSAAISSKTWTPKNEDFDTFYITGTSKAELKKVLAWIDNLSANVEELSGEDRYATAVKIAKEVAGLKEVDDTENIVLVNGNSLVDGLAAAPLAEHLAGAKGNAPILLTENDKLPTATKKYLSELVDASHNNKVTVNIVGGNGVVSKSVEKELRAMNLKVERFGGENREETSMAVAEKIVGANGLTNAFVVGATGEADAMSIAGYAAQTETPIIVSNFEGLSDDTLEELEGVSVNVIGGDNAVSSVDYNSIKDVALTIARVSGSDRKATNAAVINKFYGGKNFAGTKSVIVAKDDVLIDALTSANLSSEQHAPIVLGTDSLSKEQIDAIDKNANGASKVYQVGHGVERKVVKLVAQALELI